MKLDYLVFITWICLTAGLIIYFFGGGLQPKNRYELQIVYQDGSNGWLYLKGYGRPDLVDDKLYIDGDIVKDSVKSYVIRKEEGYIRIE